ncbi:hypothetical protein PJL18_02362 [Paenarthrobacter nicotinovorans]|nr:hypothetical protein [Paenarthrobacter nicotinovorans]
MVVRPGSARRANVTAEQANVEVPGAGVLDTAFEGAVGHSERREARRNAEALLGSGVSDVDPPVVCQQLQSADGRDGVGDEQGVALASTEGSDVGEHTHGRLGVNRGDDLGIGMR